ncbi:MAG: hypothetical protein NVS2B7_35310 [Herpetosiphon sp.]
MHPFYLQWAPDSQQIAFLTGGGTSMMLQHLALGDGKPRQVIDGQPSYLSWTPNSQQLMLHTNGEAPGGSLALRKIGDIHPRSLAPPPGAFRAPAWLPDGQSVMAAITENGGASLARIGNDGTIQARLAKTGVGMVFVLAPDGKQVAYIDMTKGTPNFLHMVNTDGSEDRLLTHRDVITFLWSPTSTAIAYLTIVNARNPGDPTQARLSAQQQPALRVQWNVMDVASGTAQHFEPFTPTTTFINLLPYFDQYAQSIRLWDRGGKRLLYAATDGVWTLDVASGASTRVATGELGVWMDP